MACFRALRVPETTPRIVCGEKEQGRGEITLQEAIKNY